MTFRLVLMCALAGAGACTQPPVDDPLPEPPDPPGTVWRLTWSDEFDGNAMTAPDPRKWKYDIGGGGWGNQQLEFDTDQLANSRLDGKGNLEIVALKQRYGSNEYTSARLRTEGNFAQAYGRFEARIKLPTGAGIWPAFWLLGANYASAGWPACGELDILELRGSEPAVAHGSAHGPGYSGANPKTASFTLPGGKRFNDDFHVFAIEWSPGEVHWFVDDRHFHAITAITMPNEHRWVFDKPMFVILNVAVGGWFGGAVDDAVFPQTMVVDYVKAFERIPQ